MTMNEPASGPAIVEARERIAVASGFALLVAAALLLTIVLPAEFGLDPFGTGERLGLTALADAGGPAAPAPVLVSSGPSRTVTPQTSLYRTDVKEFVLQPTEGMEYKYRIDKGGGLLYAWTATAGMEYEFHGEPDGAKNGAYESYELKTGERAAGNFTAPFTGIHGWYWVNKTPDVVRVRLTSAGFYTGATEFRKDKRIIAHQFPEPAPQSPTTADQ
jgi:hypothetical protein